MGSSSSVPESAKTCQYNKNQFNTLLEVIRDAHNVTQYYASVVLKEKMPPKLNEYRTYTDLSEEYFLRGFPENSNRDFRKIKKAELNMSYYQYYFYLSAIKSKYEAADTTENNRRTLMNDAFQKCQIVHKLLIEELYETCDSQGRIGPSAAYDQINIADSSLSEGPDYLEPGTQ
jgi:hypothetical protein